MKEYLRGAFDMHIHTLPDVGPRRCNDIVLAKRLQAAGMGGALVKCHFGDTAARAGILNELFPDLFFAGGVVLNRQAGGLNPYAVEACGKMGGRFVWFPTMDSMSYQLFHKKNPLDPSLEDLIYLLDDNGELKKEVLDVLEAAAKHNMVAATGHISAEEGMAVVRAARKMGIDTVLTHADLPSNAYSDEQQKEAVALGAFVEHCYFTTHYSCVSAEEIARQIRVAGCGNVYLSTDFGQPNSPFSDEGIAAYAEAMEAQGFTPEELSLMFREVPEKLLKKI
ncbi:MAG: amidohydrolase [Stomatobaculum sp.]|nr:amidohydrolase [Stomatobaculum sp.]